MLVFNVFFGRSMKTAQRPILILLPPILNRGTTPPQEGSLGISGDGHLARYTQFERVSSGSDPIKPRRRTRLICAELQKKLDYENTSAGEWRRSGPEMTFRDQPHGSFKLNGPASRLT
jgi:hypothetical protein